MTAFDDENLIRTLRSAGTDGPAFAMTPLSETTRRGRAARRRRTVLAGAGAATLTAAVVTAALAVPPLLDTPESPLNAAASDTSEPANEPTPETADDLRAANRAAVLGALPDGFVELTQENMDDAAGMAGFALAQEAPATDGLPEGMSAGISLMTFAADEVEQSMGGDQWCEGFTEKGTVTTDCVDVAVGDETVQVQFSSQPGSDERRAYEMTRTTYEQASGDVVVLDVYAWEDEVTATPRPGAARAWADTMHEQIVAIVLDPSFQPTEWKERRHSEAVDLAADLGDQWTVLDEPPAASVHPSEDLAATLPQGTSAGVSRDVLRDVGLRELCTAGTEDGIRRTACEPALGNENVLVSYGEMVDPEHRGDGSIDMRAGDVIVYHDRGNGSIVRVQVHVASHGAEPPDSASVRSWLGDQVPDLVGAATADS